MCSAHWTSASATCWWSARAPTGRCGGYCSAASRRSSCAGRRARSSWCRAAELLGRHEPPPGWLAAPFELDLGRVRCEGGHRVAGQRGADALDDRQQLGLAAEFAEDDLEGLPRFPPGDELLVDEAHGVPAAETALGVVARGLGHAARADVAQGLLHGVRVLARVHARVQRD